MVLTTVNCDARMSSNVRALKKQCAQRVDIYKTLYKLAFSLLGIQGVHELDKRPLFGD